MHPSLVGKLPLSQMISNVLEGAQTKLASAKTAGENPFEKKEEKGDEKKEKGKNPFAKKEEKSEEKEESKEKKSYVLNSIEELNKLAAALDAVGDGLLSKEADEKNIGAEKPQGGEVLPVASPKSGKQNYNRGQAHHQVPMSTPDTKASDGGPSKGVVETNETKPPVPLKQGYPKSGVLKTAGEESVIDKIKSVEAKKKEKAGRKDEGEEKKEEAKEKESAVSFIQTKLAEYLGGGERTGDFPAEQGPKPETDAKGGNDARKNISSVKAAIDMKKVEGKAPQKRMLKEVLTEPAQTKSTDPVVQNNLANASKGGVKIAAARELLKKIAEEGCTCDGAGNCRHCKMQAAMKGGQKKKESVGLGTMSPMGGAPTPGVSSTPQTPSM